MAKKVAGKKRSSSTASRSQSRGGGMEMDTGMERSNVNRFQNRFSDTKDLKEMLRDLASNPSVRYVAGGIATAVLTKIATNLSDRYPEISNFIKENVETLEDKLNDFKSGSEARH